MNNPEMARLVAPHYLAFHAAVEALPNREGRVHASVLLDTKGKLRREAYEIVYPTPPDELNDERMSAAQRAAAKATFRYEIRSVGVEALGCAESVDDLISGLVGSRLEVPGRKCSKIALDSVTRVEPDVAVSPPLFYCDVTFMFISQRAGAA